MCDIFKLHASMSQKRIVETINKDKVKTRKCLRCDSSFTSSFNGNRVCDDCKRSKEMNRDSSKDWSLWENVNNFNFDKG